MSIANGKITVHGVDELKATMEITMRVGEWRAIAAALRDVPYPTIAVRDTMLMIGGLIDFIEDGALFYDNVIWPEGDEGEDDA